MFRNIKQRAPECQKLEYVEKHWLKFNLRYT